MKSALFVSHSSVVGQRAVPLELYCFQETAAPTGRKFSQSCQERISVRGGVSQQPSVTCLRAIFTSLDTETKRGNVTSVRQRGFIQEMKTLRLSRVPIYLSLSFPFLDIQLVFLLLSCTLTRVAHCTAHQGKLGRFQRDGYHHFISQFILCSCSLRANLRLAGTETDKNAETISFFVFTLVGWLSGMKVSSWWAFLKQSQDFNLYDLDERKLDLATEISWNNRRRNHPVNLYSKNWKKKWCEKDELSAFVWDAFIRSVLGLRERFGIQCVDHRHCNKHTCKSILQTVWRPNPAFFLVLPTFIHLSQNFQWQQKISSTWKGHRSIHSIKCEVQTFGTVSADIELYYRWAWSTFEAIKALHRWSAFQSLCCFGTSTGLDTKYKQLLHS